VLLAIALAGLVALGVNERVRGDLVQAIQYDLEIEDRADDLRLAVLNLVDNAAKYSPLDRWCGVHSSAMRCEPGETPWFTPH
jgi:signal transduction histidine kinase